VVNTFLPPKKTEKFAKSRVLPLSMMAQNITNFEKISQREIKLKLKTHRSHGFFSKRGMFIKKYQFVSLAEIFMDVVFKKIRQL
jgi:hypothetical protein